MIFLAGTSGVIDINGTVIVELITFLVMLAILARYVYPEIVRVAEARQQAIAIQLREAEKARQEAEAKLKEAAGLVVSATEKVIGETLDLTKHKQLIDRAIAEVTSGNGGR